MVQAVTDYVEQTAEHVGSAVCAKCVHVKNADKHGERVHSSDWNCGAVPLRVLSPARVDPITGDKHAARTSATRCTERNSKGSCSDYRTETLPVLLRDDPLEVVGDPYRPVPRGGKVSGGDGERLPGTGEPAAVSMGVSFILGICVGVGVAALTLFG